MLTTGVYCWLSKKDSKRYVGSAARSFNLRKKEHLNALRRGIHYNSHLQGAWQKYGEINFEFVILERCNPLECLEREQVWIDAYRSSEQDFGYNFQPTAGSNLGVKWSAEVIAKFSASAKARSERPGEIERLKQIGQHPTEEDKAKCTRKNTTQNTETKKKIKKRLSKLSKLSGSGRTTGLQLSNYRRSMIAKGHG